MKEEYQVYYKGIYLNSVFADSDEEAKLDIAGDMSATKIPITKINSIIKDKERE